MKSRILGLFVLLSLFGGAFPAITYAQYGGGGPPIGLFGVFAPGPTAQTVTAPTGQVLGASAYNFTTDFCVGSSGENVTQLQATLIADGDLNISAPTGHYGSLTKAAVEKYQTANNITPATGCVGPLTRGVLNQGVTPTASQEQSSVLQNLYNELEQALAKIMTLSAST